MAKRCGPESFTSCHICSLVGTNYGMPSRQVVAQSLQAVAPTADYPLLRFSLIYEPKAVNERRSKQKSESEDGPDGEAEANQSSDGDNDGDQNVKPPNSDLPGPAAHSSAPGVAPTSISTSNSCGKRSFRKLLSSNRMQAFLKKYYNCGGYQFGGGSGALLEDWQDSVLLAVRYLLTNGVQRKMHSTTGGIRFLFDCHVQASQIPISQDRSHPSIFY